MNNRTDVKDILERYSRKLGGEIRSDEGIIAIGQGVSREYSQFKEDMLPSLNRYEKLCQGIGNIIKIKIAQKDESRIQQQIDAAHLDVSPSQAIGLAIISILLTFFAGVLITLGLYLSPFVTGFPFLLLFLFLIASLFLFYYFYTMPFRLANVWRLKASSQMVPCILYVVAYMKHTSNLERAVAFASTHLEAPLSLDFKKIFWDVETGKYPNVKESLDSYLLSWREYASEFVESFHLIESSLYEPDEDRRVLVLERALQVMLDGVYDKMLKYTHSIRSPLTNLYMLGIVLPTLGLALLPLASTLLGGALKWYHVFVLFNLIIPFFVFYLTSQVMLKRPGGYGEASVIEKNPYYPKFKSKAGYFKALLVVLPLLILGFSPFIFQTGLFGVKDFSFSQFGIELFGDVKFFDFKTAWNGPFGIVAAILSLFIPLAIALFFSIAYKTKTKELIIEREKTKTLENEFASSLFQLGNRLGDGMPAEIAFGRVGEDSSNAGNFYKVVNRNIHEAGMSLEQAIFNNANGAIIYYPSALISTSMKILVEAVKKGLQVAANSLMSISQYVKNIQKINQRLKDLLAEITSDMQSNMTFLAPLLAGIVVGLASMITLILSKLGVMTNLEGLGDAGVVSLSTVTDLFKIENMIPPFFIQLAIGIYLVEIVFILTSTLVTVDAGEDKLKKVYDTGINLKRGILLYFLTSLIAILVLGIIAAVALGGMGS